MQRYGLFTSEDGGILDDLMTVNAGDHLYLVVNAACRDQDIAHLRRGLPDHEVEVVDRGLLALQGPGAEAALAALNPAVAELRFMDVATVELAGVEAWVSRSGYTGEDGYEISVPEGAAVALAEALLAQDTVEPIGLGARDSLRLEAGLCLYGHELDTTVSPIEAGLIWSIQKNRREGCDYLGAERIASDLADKTTKRLVGIQPEGSAPAREHTEIQDMDGNSIGEITSGGFGPSAGGPVAMGYVARKFVKAGTDIQLIVRGKARPAKVVKLPFVPHTYYRGA